MRSMVSPGRLAPPAPFLPRPPDPGAPDPSAPDPCVVPTISVMLFLFLRRAVWGSARRGRRWRAGSAACPATVADALWTCGGDGLDMVRPSARLPGVGHPAGDEGFRSSYLRRGGGDRRSPSRSLLWRRTSDRRSRSGGTPPRRARAVDRGWRARPRG